MLSANPLPFLSFSTSGLRRLRSLPSYRLMHLGRELAHLLLYLDACAMLPGGGLLGDLLQRHPQRVALLV